MKPAGLYVAADPDPLDHDEMTVTKDADTVGHPLDLGEGVAREEDGPAVGADFAGEASKTPVKGLVTRRHLDQLPFGADAQRIVRTRLVGPGAAAKPNRPVEHFKSVRLHQIMQSTSAN